MRSALITGLAGCRLGADERDFLSEVRPAGVILFSRNCESPDQIRSLVADAVASIGADDVLVLIDQEGGRVQRLRPPLGRTLPSARALGELYEADPDAAVAAGRLIFRLLAHDLRGLGINCDCAPVLDIPVPGADGIIGDRAYAVTPGAVIALGRAVCQGLMAGGVVPVIKHIPGHGRAGCDSHLALPVVDASLGDLRASDFAPFQALADIPAAMTAHVVYTAIDAQAPATTSRAAIGGIIRDEIGFSGLLMSDDLSMKALSGPMGTRAAAAIAAGCDLVLHCNGEFDEMRAAAAGSPELQDAALARFNAAFSVTRTQIDFDAEEAVRVLERMLASGRS
ncbi:MAG: beta-N-acetylhexosaminidase [Alphaproteobacteria bacterium]|nr:beta-N-acetylhexosaminidase [Alphaproteobacteria bacterium]